MRYDVNDMLKRFTTVWGEPKTDDVDAFMGEFEIALSGTEPRLLKLATDACIAQEIFWPRVAVVKKQVDLAAARKEVPQTRFSYTGPKKHFPSILVKPIDVGWKSWMAEIDARLGPEARAAAERLGVIDVQCTWPRDGIPMPRLPQIRNPAGRDA